MKNKYFICSILIVLFSSLLLYMNFNGRNNNKKVISYNGTNLSISVDGEAVTSLPTVSGYRLNSYVCDNTNTKVSWDSNNYELIVTNGEIEGLISCDLEFLSTPPLLSEVPVGSYVAYEGVGGTVGSTAVACKKGGAASSSTATAATEAPNSCLGQNAREDIDTNGNTYGYCHVIGKKYYTTGWRLAYVDSKNKPVIISAGSPECNIRTSSNANAAYIAIANALALKYCNTEYVDGDCTCTSSTSGRCSSPSTDAWSINDNDFNMITKAITSTTTGGYLYTAIEGATKCGGVYSTEICGYNNDLLDNGGYYLFAAVYSSSDYSAVYWDPSNRNVNYGNTANAYGLRPVISLRSDVYVAGGNGTMDNPYTIGVNDFNINDGVDYVYSNTVNLNLSYIPTVTKMCISVDSPECTNYVNVASTYSLNLADGKRTVYVYYKNAVGTIVDSMQDSIIVNGAINIDDGYSHIRTLSVYGNDATHMCISDTNISSSDCTWVDYQDNYNWSFDRGTGNRTIYAYFKNAEGVVKGPYTDTINCGATSCGYAYFLDAYSNSHIYFMRSDGATAKVASTATSITWATPDSQEMYNCAANSRATDGYIYCIGTDNNLYYKAKASTTSWSMVSGATGYIDTNKYSYSLYVTSSNSYLFRSDGRINKSSTTALTVASANWTYGADKDLIACSGIGDGYIACMAKDGYHYFRSGSTTYNTTTAYGGGVISGLTTDRNVGNTWVDVMYGGSGARYAHLMEIDDTNFYSYRITYNTTTAATLSSWTSAPIPGGGVRVCASTGYSGNVNYCLAEDGMLYQKSYTATSWATPTIVYESSL